MTERLIDTEGERIENSTTWQEHEAAEAPLVTPRVYSVYNTPPSTTEQWRSSIVLIGLCSGMSNSGSGSNSPIHFSHRQCYMSHSWTSFMSRIAMKLPRLNRHSKKFTSTFKEYLVIWKHQKVNYCGLSLWFGLLTNMANSYSSGGCRNTP